MADYPGGPLRPDPIFGTRFRLQRNAQPDPVADSRFARSLWATSILLIAVIGAFAVAEMAGGAPRWLGIQPRQPWGWLGVLTTVFVHGDLEHLAANCVGLAVAGFVLLNLYPTVALRVQVWVALGGGLLLYLFGKCCTHIGASGLIYGINAFLLVSGLLRQDRGSLAVVLVVIFTSPGLLWGMSPLQPAGISWEGHLFGAFAGALVAIRYRRYDRPPPPPRYDWETDEDTDPDDGAAESPQPPQPPPLRIVYHNPTGDSGRAT